MRIELSEVFYRYDVRSGSERSCVEDRGSNDLAAGPITLGAGGCRMCACDRFVGPPAYGIKCINRLTGKYSSGCYHLYQDHDLAPWQR
jgi:hypothetical protein